MPIPTEMGEILNFMDNEWFETPKMDCMTKTKNSIILDSKFVDLENTGERATLKVSREKSSVGFKPGKLSHFPSQMTGGSYSKAYSKRNSRHQASASQM